jgi:hypothetical protein
MRCSSVLHAGLARTRLVSALANDVKARCRAKRIFGDAKVDFDTVVIAGSGNNLRVKPATGDSWLTEGALPDGTNTSLTTKPHTSRPWTSC